MSIKTSANRIEIHIIKNYPASCLNRDESGAPKTMAISDSIRGRISSQCLNRLWRNSDMFRDAVGEKYFGCRTRTLPTLIAKELETMGVEKARIDAIMPVLCKIGKKNEKESKEDTEKEGSGKEGGTSAKDEKADITKTLMFFCKDDVVAAATVIKDLMDAQPTVAAVKKLKINDVNLVLKNSGADVRPITVDIALWGRMVTNDGFRNVDGALQTAHAFATNRLVPESDFFIGADDLLNGASIDESGAGMMGEVDFNSSCYYIYASLDVKHLKHNLRFTEEAENLVRAIVPALIKTMALTNPTGKQHSFAAFPRPSAVYLVCTGEDWAGPASLANAFVNPIVGGDVIRKSVQALADAADSETRNYGNDDTERIWFAVDDYNIAPESATKVCKNFKELLDAASATLD